MSQLLAAFPKWQHVIAGRRTVPTEKELIEAYEKRQAEDENKGKGED